jgi:plasmid stabilization system protein ParE
MKPTGFHAEAEQEYFDAIAFYDAEHPHLGDEFVEAVASASAFISGNPEAGRRVRPTVRRWVVKRFPYALFYVDEPERIYILAVAHHRRKPGYWLNRV